MSFIADSPQYSPTLLRARLNWNRTIGEDWQHGIYRLVWVKEGQHQVILKDQNLIAPAGTLYLIKPGQWQAVANQRKSSAMLLAFTIEHCELKRSGRAWDPVQSEHQQPAPKEIWGIDIPNVLERDLSLSLTQVIPVICSIWWRDRWSHYRANSLLRDLLDRIINHYGEKKASDEQPDAPHDWISGVYQLIEQRLSNIHTTTDLAAAFGMERNQFTRRFREASGQTPAVYLKTRRLQEAALLMRKSSWSIDQVAGHLGYPSRGAFHQAWRKSYVDSPASWRRKQIP